MKKKKVELSPIRIEIKNKRALKKKLKKRILVLKSENQTNLVNAAESLLKSVLSDLKALHDKEVAQTKKAARQAIKDAKNEAQRVNDKLDIQFLYSLTI